MSVVKDIEQSFKKPHIVAVKSGDTVRVHQKIREGNKERIQVFEGLVIRTSRLKSHTSSVTIRRISSGVGVEKTYLIHSPLVTKIEVAKRSKVRRNYLSYMRQRTGKSARLSSMSFDREAVNAVPDVDADNEEKKLKEEAAKEHEAEAAKKIEEEAKAEAKIAPREDSTETKEKSEKKPTESKKESEA